MEFGSQIGLQGVLEEVGVGEGISFYSAANTIQGSDQNVKTPNSLEGNKSNRRRLTRMGLICSSGNTVVVRVESIDRQRDSDSHSDIKNCNSRICGHSVGRVASKV